MTSLPISKLAVTLISTFSTFAFGIVFAVFSGCGALSHANDDTDKPNVKIHSLAGDPKSHKSIFVFLDGTMNDTNSGTNVWRLYDLLARNDDPQMTGIYIEGVGSIKNPVFGPALGRGMEERILRGYEFIAQHYRPGDDIYLFGFSRGAHETRSLAGLLAYAGVPILSEGDRNRLATIGNRILELIKDESDKDYLETWASWKPGQAPLLAGEIEDELGIEMRTTEVTFLGVWDTVPGSSFKKYKDCIEKIGFWKTWFYWLPVINKGERYKTGSYPVIHRIAHAVSLDEKRSKFAPLLLCPAINPEYTKLTEVWFPGAHADVGGGYEDSNELPGISLNWMLKQLSESYKFNTALPHVEESATGLAHWSIGDSPANMGSECIDRQPPKDAKIDASFHERKKASPVLIRIKKAQKTLPYPIICSADPK